MATSEEGCVRVEKEERCCRGSAKRGEEDGGDRKSVV